jgi:hypothetical protein
MNSPTMDAFKTAFKGNKTWLAEKFDVTNGLLRALDDADIINGEHLLKIKQTSNNADRVDELLSILERQDDSLFSKFCDILTERQKAACRR